MLWRAPRFKTSRSREGLHALGAQTIGARRGPLLAARATGRPAPARIYLGQILHSTGAAVDLTLVALQPAEAAPYDAKAAYAACNAARETREPDNSLDMGPSFDAST